MAEFQWWLLIVGLVAGGGLVTLVFMDGARRANEIDERVRPAEATWFSERLAAVGRDVDPYTAEAVLWAHKEYLALPPPDRIEIPGETDPDAETDFEPARVSGDRDADRASDEKRDNGSRGPDGDLAPAGEQEAPPGEEAHAGAHGEEAHQR
jgi:hypothetical protein